jgi:hypothetical protein
MIHRDTLTAAAAIYKGGILPPLSHRLTYRDLHRNAWTGRWLYSSNLPDHIYGTQCCPMFSRFTDCVVQIGWKPGPDQPQPLKRGSGQTNLKEVL